MNDFYLFFCVFLTIVLIFGIIRRLSSKTKGVDFSIPSWLTPRLALSAIMGVLFFLILTFRPDFVWKDWFLYLGLAIALGVATYFQKWKWVASTCLAGVLILYSSLLEKTLGFFQEETVLVEINGQTVEINHEEFCGLETTRIESLSVLCVEGQQNKKIKISCKDWGSKVFFLTACEEEKIKFPSRHEGTPVCIRLVK